MDVTLFDFDLPEDRIALRPARPRDSARMLVVRPDLDGDAALAHATARDLPDFLNPGDVLVFNDTRVIPARLHGRRGEAGVEVTLHQHVGGTSWKVFARPARKCRVGDRLVFGELAASVTAQGDGGERTLAFDVAEEDFAAALEQAGIMPLPPYIASKRAVDALDEEDYQTAFADRDGSVAAPTAGLHFTDGLLAALDARGVRRQGVTLHVGAGTFLPVKATDTRDHKMHSEWGEVSAEAAAWINAARAAGGRIVAVGTTSMRLLESAVDENGILHPFDGETDIFITPGFRFRAVDVLMTNFHLPKSTLFMLVSAFSGLDMMKRAYGAAVEKGYRFYSYGDASLLHRPTAGVTDGSEDGADKS